MKKITITSQKETNGDVEYNMSDKESTCQPLFKSSMDNETAKKCLTMQKIFSGLNSDIINKIMDDGEVVSYKRGQTVTRQGDAGDATYFILKGTLDVLVNNRKVAERKAKECVGEMSVLDPTQNRCATLVTSEDTHLLKISSAIMDNLLSDNPIIVRNIAIELCVRLRERARYHKMPNSKPRIFIGSSSEGLHVAKQLSKRLNVFDTNLWDKDVFNPSEYNIEALVNQAQSSDFAILVFNCVINFAKGVSRGILWHLTVQHTGECHAKKSHPFFNQPRRPSTN
ncbi:MAG: cyclic nucleotide-binding domain-containing protein, partial [Victivallales bacterium]|nr:cyclic nucleotide-binding domain-containing protein [Victivallales bacterium]